VQTVVKEGSDRPLQEKPGKCPCERGKAIADSVPANGSSPQEFDESLRTAHLFAAAVQLVDPFDAAHRDSDSPSRCPRRNQRECLTALCVMRC